MVNGGDQLNCKIGGSSNPQRRFRLEHNMWQDLIGDQSHCIIVL